MGDVVGGPLPGEPLGERLARMEGILVGLQASISQSRADGAAFMARVERLEQRQVELEREMITRDDIAALAADVKALSASDAKQQGGTALAGWGAQAIGNWAAVIIALLALIGVGTNRERMNSEQQHYRTTPDAGSTGR